MKKVKMVLTLMICGIITTTSPLLGIAAEKNTMIAAVNTNKKLKDLTQSQQTKIIKILNDNNVSTQETVNFNVTIKNVAQNSMYVPTSAHGTVNIINDKKTGKSKSVYILYIDSAKSKKDIYLNAEIISDINEKSKSNSYFKVNNIRIASKVNKSESEDDSINIFKQLAGLKNKNWVKVNNDMMTSIQEAFTLDTDTFTSTFSSEGSDEEKYIVQLLQDMNISTDGKTTVLKGAWPLNNNLVAKLMASDPSEEDKAFVNSGLYNVILNQMMVKDSPFKINIKISNNKASQFFYSLGLKNPLGNDITYVSITDNISYKIQSVYAPKQFKDILKVVPKIKSVIDSENDGTDDSDEEY